MEHTFKVSLGITGLEHWTEQSIKWRILSTEIIELESLELNNEAQP